MKALRGQENPWNVINVWVSYFGSRVFLTCFTSSQSSSLYGVLSKVFKTSHNLIQTPTCRSFEKPSKRQSSSLFSCHWSRASPTRTRVMNRPRRWARPISRTKRITKLGQSPLPSTERMNRGRRKIRKHGHSFDIDQGPSPGMK